MSLPFFSEAIFVNSLAIIWWCPIFFWSVVFRYINSGQTSLTKYKKLSWHSLTCSIQSFSTSSLSFSVGKLSAFIQYLYYIWEVCPICTSIQLTLKIRFFLDTHIPPLIYKKIRLIFIYYLSLFLHKKKPNPKTRFFKILFLEVLHKIYYVMINTKV